MDKSIPDYIVSAFLDRRSDQFEAQQKLVLDTLALYGLSSKTTESDGLHTIFVGTDYHTADMIMSRIGSRVSCISSNVVSEE